MSAKMLKFNQEARQDILHGVEKLSKAVKATLGPRGEASFWTKNGVRPR